MNKKINCIEGIRAIACMSIFLYSFRNAFLPVFSYWGDVTPLRILTSGDAMIRIMFTLSGFVISHKYFLLKRYDDIPLDIFKKYFRLAPHVLVANVVVCFMMKLGILYNSQAGKVSGSVEFLSAFNNFEPDIVLCLKESLILCFFQGKSTYIAPLWIIGYEYLGTILVLCAISICRKSDLRYLFYIVFLLFFNSYYNYFVLGMLVCEIYCDKDISDWLNQHKKFNNWLFVISFLIISLLNINDDIKIIRVVYAIGISGFLLALLCSSWGDKILGNRFMQKCGKLSFAVYITHLPIIESFSSVFFVKFNELGYNDTFIVMLNLILTSFLIWLIAHSFFGHIERISNAIVKSFEKKYGGLQKS